MKTLHKIIIGAVLTLIPGLSHGQFLGPPTAYSRVTADTLSDTALTVVQVPTYGGSATVKMRSITMAQLAAKMNTSGGDIDADSIRARVGLFDTLSCTTCYFNDTTLSVQDSLLAGFDAVFGIADADSIHARAIRATGNVGIGAATDPAFTLGVGGNVAVTNTNTASFSLLTLNQSASGGTTPAGLLRYGSTYATTALRNKLEVFGTGGLRFTVGGDLNKEANIDTFAVYRGPGAVLDSLTVTGHSNLDSLLVHDDAVFDSNAVFGKNITVTGKSTLEDTVNAGDSALFVTRDSVMVSVPFKGDSLDSRVTRSDSVISPRLSVGSLAITQNSIHSEDGANPLTIEADENLVLEAAGSIIANAPFEGDSINTRALVVTGTTTTHGRVLNFLNFNSGGDTLTMADSMDVVYFGVPSGQGATFILQTSAPIGRQVKVIFALDPSNGSAVTMVCPDCDIQLPTGEPVTALPHEAEAGVYVISVTLVWTGSVWLVIDSGYYFGTIS